MSAITTTKSQALVAEQFLEVKAKRIKDLSQRWAENTIALGTEFKQVRNHFSVNGSGKRPGWHDWVKANTSWTPDHVGRFIRIADRFSSARLPSNLTAAVLNYLARPDLPDAGVEQVIDRARKGHKVTTFDAREIVQPFLPTRAEAIKQARETGKLVTARDGNMYSGATQDEMDAYSERRSLVFGIERAFDLIAACPCTPTELLDRAEDHWLTEMNLGHLDAAIKFLTKLQPLLAKKQKVVQ